MNLYDLVKLGNMEETYDDVFDASVTVYMPDKVEDNYDLFCCEICKRVKPISVTGDGTIVVGWSGLILDNMEKFRDFSEKYWKNQYDDDDDFVFEWINEIHMYMAGYVSEDFYGVLVDFVNTLN